MSGKALCSIRAHCYLGLRFVAITTKRFRIHNLFRSETQRFFLIFSSYFRNMPRDPYPFPRLQNDSDFYGQQGKQVKENRTLAKSNSDGTAWDRLNKTATLASSRREIFHHDPQAPHDSLDFVIKSTYDHHKEFLSSKAETLVQHETAGLPHGRILKNRPPPEEPEVDLYKLPLMKSTSTQRQSIHSINGAIESHHSAATNGGYSRKHDGGFYTC